MDAIIHALTQAIENKNWYGALFIALSLPDICSDIDTPGEYSKPRYINWYNNNLLPKYTIRRIKSPDYTQSPDPTQSYIQWRTAAYPESEEASRLKKLWDQAMFDRDFDLVEAITNETKDYWEQNSPMAEDFVFLSGKDCYALRCAYLHQGLDDMSGQSVKDVIERFRFTAPKYFKDGSPAEPAHMNTSGTGTLQLQVDIFCNDILDAVNEWKNRIAPSDKRYIRLLRRLKIHHL